MKHVRGVAVAALFALLLIGQREIMHDPSLFYPSAAAVIAVAACIYVRSSLLE